MHVRMLATSFVFFLALASFVPAQGPWLEITTAERPIAQRRFGFDTDPSSGISVLFGGRDGNSTRRDETFIFGGAQTWSQVMTSTQPSPRDGTSMVFDPMREVFVLFGGEGQSQFFNDTWEFDGAVWLPWGIPSMLRPSVRGGHGMAFDPLMGETLVFGGEEMFNGRRNDLWAFDGSSWRNRAPTGGLPSPRSDMRLVYDAARGVHVMFGGFDSNGVYLNDTWEYSSAANTWTLVSTPNAPAPRLDYAMEYDATRGVVVLHGGRSQFVSFGDTWEYDGSDWVGVSTVATPGTRVGADFAPAATGLFLHGGATHDDTWVYGASPVLTPGSGGDGSVLVARNDGPFIAPTQSFAVSTGETVRLTCRSLGGTLDFARFALVSTLYFQGSPPSGLGLLGSGGFDVWVDPTNIQVVLDGFSPPSLLLAPTLVPGGFELGPYNVPFGLSGQALVLQVLVSDLAGSPLGISSSDAITLQFL